MIYVEIILKINVHVINQLPTKVNRFIPSSPITNIDNAADTFKAKLFFGIGITTFKNVSKTTLLLYNIHTCIISSLAFRHHGLG